MNRLIQDILDVTRLDARRLTVERAVVSTRETLDALIDAQRPLAKAQRLDFNVEVADDLPDVWGDRDRLLQILENLIGNALKFTKRGGITIGAIRRDDEVVFWVRDTGIGMPADELAHVFDRFWQGRKEARSGAGLGLAIVKGLVEAHAGHVWVESTLGQGTCFYFTIPVAPHTPWQEAAHAAMGS
jgi:signal transduction histidine kinase